MGNETPAAAITEAPPVRVAPPLDYARLTRVPLRWTLAWVIVALLGAEALSEYKVAIRRTEATGVWMAPVATARIEAALHRAFSGSGPDDIDMVRLRPGGDGRGSVLPDAATLHFSDGSFDIAVALRDEGPYRLGWRLATPADSPTVLWACGFARLPEDARELPNPTTLPAPYLPPICRDLP